jgi:hypothetical protein
MSRGSKGRQYGDAIIDTASTIMIWIDELAMTKCKMNVRCFTEAKPHNRRKGIDTKGKRREEDERNSAPGQRAEANLAESSSSREVTANRQGS